MTKCGFKPHGYTPCPRDLGHEGPCAHELVDFKSVAIDLRSVAIDFDSTPEELERLFWETFEAMFGKRGSA